MFFSFVFTFFISFYTFFAQSSDEMWKILMSVKYKYYKDAYIPQFTDNIKAYDGKTVTLKGYIYPLEESSKHTIFMLSYYPISVCFFCGGAGPESVVEVNAKTFITHTSKPITIKGKLKLNKIDRERVFYILLNAEAVY
jgi:hypothetical protein